MTNIRPIVPIIRYDHESKDSTPGEIIGLFVVTFLIVLMILALVKIAEWFIDRPSKKK